MDAKYLTRQAILQQLIQQHQLPTALHSALSDKEQVIYQKYESTDPNLVAYKNAMDAVCRTLKTESAVAAPSVPIASIKPTEDTFRKSLIDVIAGFRDYQKSFADCLQYATNIDKEDEKVFKEYLVKIPQEIAVVERLLSSSAQNINHSTLQMINSMKNEKKRVRTYGFDRYINTVETLQSSEPQKLRTAGDKLQHMLSHMRNKSSPHFIDLLKEQLAVEQAKLETVPHQTGSTAPIITANSSSSNVAKITTAVPVSFDAAALDAFPSVLITLAFGVQQNPDTLHADLQALGPRFQLNGSSSAPLAVFHGRRRILEISGLVKHLQLLLDVRIPIDFHSETIVFCVRQLPACSPPLAAAAIEHLQTLCAQIKSTSASVMHEVVGAWLATINAVLERMHMISPLNKTKA